MTKEQIELLRDWQSDASTLLYANFALAEKYRNKGTTLGSTSAVLSTIVGTAVFVSIGKSPELYAQIAVGLTSVGAAVLAAMHAFLRHDELAGKYHRTGAGAMPNLENKLRAFLLPIPRTSRTLAACCRKFVQNGTGYGKTLLPCRQKHYATSNQNRHERDPDNSRMDHASDLADTRLPNDGSWPSIQRSTTYKTDDKFGSDDGQTCTSRTKPDIWIPFTLPNDHAQIILR